MFVHVHVRLENETAFREGDMADVHTFRDGKVTNGRVFTDRSRGAAPWRASKVAPRRQEGSQSTNIETVNRYLDGFARTTTRRSSSLTGRHHLDCLRCVHGLTGKTLRQGYIDGAPHFIDPPELTLFRMVQSRATS